MAMKLQFVLLLLCLPAVLAFLRPAGEEGKEEERDDELEDKELSPPDHIAGAPREECLSLSLLYGLYCLA